MAEPGDKKMNQYLQYSSIGLEMGLSTALGLLMGMGLDKWLGSAPWLTILFLFFGMVAGFRRLFILARAYQKEVSKKNSHE